jgi:uncharacterized protein YkwD
MSPTCRVVALALALMVLAAGSARADELADPESSSEAMLARINEARSAEGLPPLAHAPRLERSAAAYGRRLMAEDRFGHDGWIETSARFRVLGEILSFHRGGRLRPAFTLRGWLASFVHRSLVLGPFSHAGPAPVKGRFGGRRAVIWVVHFGGR